MATPVGTPGLASAMAMLLPLVHDLFTTRYTCIAAFTLLVYDYFLLLGQEIEYFWEKGFTVGKVLFLFNRYFGIGLLALDLIVLFTRHADPTLDPELYDIPPYTFCSKHTLSDFRQMYSGLSGTHCSLSLVSNGLLT
ncbi:hypothetical protein M422DRAFT_249729 [Sphaerobolus stellatus SS14]|uniref:DUF6533 domain-containing protein n=1 Tax=Sphaerobolus stellatus (strain SS14) TaxID=990650 RepID=A0A0C9VUH2_SPHS4|nr:hypothetical protein M422DRAFT_249729 [Sphaerobolus stellatus SS14]